MAFLLPMLVGFAAACGGEDVPPAPPGVPINPPQENSALAAMLADSPTPPKPTATASAAPAAMPSASASAAPAPSSSSKATKPQPPPKKP